MIESYKELSIGKFNEINEIRKDYLGNDLDAVVEILSVLCDEEIEDIETLPLNEFHNRVTKMMFLNEKPKPYRRLPKKITINNKTYRIEKDAFSISAGQYIDYSLYMKDIKDIYANLPKIMTVFVIPDKAKGYGEGYDLMELAKEFNEHMDVETAVSIAAFFLTVCTFLINRTANSLITTLRKMAKTSTEKETIAQMIVKTEQLKHLMKDGAGLIGL